MRCHAERESGNKGVLKKSEDKKGAVASGDDDAQIERVGVKTGNHLIDQFDPVYFGVAYSFIFSNIE